MLPLLHNNHLFFFPAQNTRKYLTETQTQRPVNALYVTIDPPALTFGLVVKVERCKHTERGPTWRNAALNFLQKNFFLQLRLLFQFNQTLPQRSQTVHIRKQMNIRNVPLFLSSLPPPVFTCLKHEFQMLEHMDKQTFALCIRLNAQQNILFWNCDKCDLFWEKRNWETGGKKLVKIFQPLF